MTHAAPRGRGGKTWILPTAAIVLVGLLVAVGLLSRSLFLDALSWWPVWLVLAGVGAVGRGMKVGSLRIPGLVAIGSVLIVAAFVVGHLQGWGIFPSAAGHLVGSPAGDFTTAALSARVPGGDLQVDSGEALDLYSVRPVRLGGDVAMPSAVERAQDRDVSIELSSIEERDWLLWAGWNLRLSGMPNWTLTLEGVIDADLAGLKVDNLQLIGSGSVVLGQAGQSTPVSTSGDFVIDVPPGVPVRVIGPAQIPDGWNRTETGASSPHQGQGWVISVAEGSVVQIREH